MGNDIYLRCTRVSRDRIHKGHKIRNIDLRVGPALRGRRQLLRGLSIIGNGPQFLHRIAGTRESLLNAFPRFIPITGVAGIAVNKNDRTMLQSMALADAAPASQPVGPFLVFQCWKVWGKGNIGSIRTAMSHLMCRGRLPDRQKKRNQKTSRDQRISSWGKYLRLPYQVSPDSIEGV